MDGAATLTLDETTTLTVGYEKRGLADFVELLRTNRVSRVIDVRELPLSRRKGFSKTPLRTALEADGIEYAHLRAAGNPFRAGKADIGQCLASYRAHLEASPDVVDLVEAHVVGCRAALLCVEADACGCHRSVIVDALRRRAPRWQVLHL